MESITAIRIVNVDYYLAAPMDTVDVMYSEFRGSPVKQVPIIRIFGSTNEGKKICLHVHGVFPYLYIPYDGLEDGNILKYQIAANLDKAINISFGKATSTTQHVYKISLVSGIPFYGYHSREHQFFRINLYNPNLIRKVANLLQSDAFLGKFYQPHETHIQFTLQFMIDYNLHGMSKIILSELKFRSETGQKQSLCELEADALAQHIVNRMEIGNLAVNPGIAALWEDEKQRRRLKNENSQIGPCLSLNESSLPPTKSHLMYKQALAEKLIVFSDAQSQLDQVSTANLSVYPAETPRTKSLMNASNLDFCDSLSNETLLDESCSGELFNDSLSLNSTLDEAGMDLYKVLKELAENVNDERDNENDGILSQQLNLDEEEDEVGELGESDLDMSLPLNTGTPVKLDLQNENNSSDSDLFENSFNDTLVPQLDGQFDEESSTDSEEKLGKLSTQKKRQKKSQKFPQLAVSILSSQTSQKNSTKTEVRKQKEPLAKVKRKLSFAATGNELNATIYEEMVECQLTPKRRKEHISFETSPNKHAIIEDYFSTNFDDKRDVSLSKAQLHDLETNYKPKQGCSTKLTQSSESDGEQNLAKNNKLDEDILSNESKYSSSQSIPPYQVEQDLWYENFPQNLNYKKPTPGCSKKLTQSFESDQQQNLASNSKLEEIVRHESKYSSSQYQADQELRYKTSPQNLTYKPIPGCSKKFAQSFESDQEQNLASNSELKEIVSNESKYLSSQSIHPYQSEQGFRCSRDSSMNLYVIQPRRKAPSKQSVLESLSKLNISEINHRPPFYSKVEDVTGSVEVGYSVLKILSKTTAHAEDFKSHFEALAEYRQLYMPENLKWTFENAKNVTLQFCKNDSIFITPLNKPPSCQEVKNWVWNNLEQKKNKEILKPKSEKTKVCIPASQGVDESEMEISISLTPCEEVEKVKSVPQSLVIKDNCKKSDKNVNNSCLISGITLNNTFGFKITPENYQDAKAVNEYQHLTIISVELHISTRGEFKPHPSFDAVKAIFYSIHQDSPNASNKTGVIALNSHEHVSIMQGVGVLVENTCVNCEEELFNEFISLIHKYDPDIFVGYEIQMLSWGYLIDRANILSVNLIQQLSRIKDEKYKGFNDEDNLKITGRIVLDIWRLLRSEIAVQSYTFESMMYHILHRRVPFYSFKELRFWWDNPSAIFRNRTVLYYILRVENNLKLLHQLDLIGRTSELARLFGIQFFEVLSRGSQFRVESMMLRLAKPLNYVPASPSVQQRAKMKAPEFLPLILEPESKLYVDPVIVLDFQSLYPSIIIAYNYCFSTCVGRVKHLGKNSSFEFGATQLKISKARLEKLLKKDCLNFSPCGVAFVKKNIRDGIMPRMLREILDTRLMVKNSLKENKGNKVLTKVLHNRQLGLKLIANVTYGYTAANFSGRMPAVELGDSVVSKGRETLQRAIALVENKPEWGAKVVYGDTDSLFVMVPGKSRLEAFEVGKKIADAVTNDNPDPVKLKLEKVYQPCILQTKKRYVGYMYESSDQAEPIYEAKGIETVRRDGCPAVSKMLEKCLRLLFETKDVSLVKKFVLKQFHKIFSGRVSLQDLTFAKEYRGAGGYRPGACVPALELARKWTAVDKRNEPRSGERVPYIVANGPPGLPLIRLVRSPREFFSEPSLRPNALYYITKVIIPPINRCFKLIGADLDSWYNQMPRKQYQYLPTSSPGPKKFTISQYFVSMNCAVCGDQTQDNLCNLCRKDVQKSTVILCQKLLQWERAHQNTKLICQSCTGILDKQVCISLDCPVLYKLNQTNRDLQQTSYVREILNSPDYGF